MLTNPLDISQKTKSALEKIKRKNTKLALSIVDLKKELESFKDENLDLKKTIADLKKKLKSKSEATKNGSTTTSD